MHPIYQINIATPCHEDWNKMSPSEQGRFCGACQKQVVDFSTMPDSEVIHHLQHATSSVCARAGEDQLNRNLTLVHARKSGWSKYWFAMLAGLSLLFSKADAQTKKPKHPKHTPLHQPDRRDRFPGEMIQGAIATVRVMGEEWTLSGAVVDERNQPIPFASIRIGSNGMGRSADSTGHFTIDMKSRPDSLKVSVSCAGYEQRDMVVYPEQNGFVDMGEIELKQPMLKEIVVTGQSLQMEHKTTGLTYTIMGGSRPATRSATPARDTTLARVFSTVKEWVAGTEVKVLPNPVSRNARFNVRLAPGGTGEYTLQLTDMNGKIIGGRKVNIISPVQMESFDGQLFESGGIYIVSLVAHKDGRVYSNRVVVQ